MTELPKRKEIPEGLWEKCPKCDEIIYTEQKEENLDICPKCSHHFPMTAQKRIKLITDEGSFTEIDASVESIDTLKFKGVSSYLEKLAANQKKTGMKDAVVCGRAALNGIPYALGVMDFRFLGASMGAVVGEKITRLIEFATAKKLPLVIVTASGGARMYEGMISLMQMAKTSGAVERHAEAGLPYIVLMTHPTTAGVTASFASLGDLIFAEPDALIGFAGPRVIKETTQAQLPEGFQTAEFLLKKGLIDRIIDRKKLREELSLALEYFSSGCKVSPVAETGKVPGKNAPVKAVVTEKKTAGKKSVKKSAGKATAKKPAKKSAGKAAAKKSVKKSAGKTAGKKSVKKVPSSAKKKAVKKTKK